jgi:hypothetical protein
VGPSASSASSAAAPARAPGAVMAQFGFYLFDADAEYQLNERMPFGRFVGERIDGCIRDATKLWLLRSRLAGTKLIESV